jgi:hypothetical protein
VSIKKTRLDIKKLKKKYKKTTLGISFLLMRYCVNKTMKKYVYITPAPPLPNKKRINKQHQSDKAQQDSGKPQVNRNISVTQSLTHSVTHSLYSNINIHKNMYFIYLFPKCSFIQLCFLLYTTNSIPLSTDNVQNPRKLL